MTSPDNSIVYASNIGLYRVSAEGGEPELLAAPEADEGELFFAWPEFLPGGRVVLFTIVPVGSATGAQIAMLDLETLEQTIILRGGSSARYSSTGHLVYSTGTRLHAVAFDLKALEVRGQPSSTSSLVANHSS